MSIPMLDKKITWDGSQWLCDDLTVCIKIETEKGPTPIDIDPEGISIVANPDCLVMGTPQLGFDKQWVVPVTLRDGLSIGPGGVVSADSLSSQAIPACRTGSPSTAASPARRMEIQVEVTVKFAPPGLGAAIGAAGMVPGGAWTMNQVIPPITLKSKLAYQVVPPHVVWSVYGDYQPVRLSGGKTAESVTISGNLLPPGWADSAVVEFALSEKSQKLGLGLEASGTDSTSSLDYIVNFTSQQLCMSLVKELTHNENVSNTAIELQVCTKSEYLGTQVETLPIDAQALDVSLYYGKKPAALYDWNDKTNVIVIPAGKGTETIPKSCQLPLELRYFNNWPTPEVKWEFDSGSEMDDKLSATGGEKNKYTAPGIESWNNAAKPDVRTLWCKVGTGSDTSPVEIPDNPDLYSYMPIEADIHLTDKLRRVTLVVRLGPADLMSNPSLDLSNPDIMKSLVRETEVEVEYL